MDIRDDLGQRNVMAGSDILRLKRGERFMDKRGIFKAVIAVIALLSSTCMGQAPASTAGTAPSDGIEPALMAKAKAGNPDAEFLVGTKYELGNQVKKDPAQAAEWYRKAAEKGDVRAQHSLGVLYEYGNGVPTDAGIAVQWYRKAAEKGFAPAQFSLGLCYADGKGVAQDFKQAMTWYESAAQQKNADALVNLAYLYHNGMGVARDEVRSLEYVRQAAEAGSPEAQFQLGMMFDQGEQNLPIDEGMARKWLHRSAAQGHVPAQFNYAMLLKAEPEEVYFWLGLATPRLSGKTAETSKELREKAGKRLSPSERTDIDRRVEAWHPVVEQP